MGANNSSPANYSAPAYVILAIDIVLTTAAVVGRTASRRMMKTTTAADDYLCYLAFFANLGLLISGLLLIAFGALDLDHLSNQSDRGILSVNTATLSPATLYVLAITFIKLSILFFYRRTFTMNDRWFRWCWWLLLSLVVLWTGTCVILLALQETGTVPHDGFGRLGISTTGIINGFSDLLLVILPAARISSMKMKKKQKIALISIFGIGGFAAIISLIRGAIFFINRHHYFNLAYANYLDIVLTATESSAGFMCACLPLTKPIIIRFTHWLQKLRLLDTDHQGWTTLSESSRGEGCKKTITRTKDYDVQLLPMSELVGSHTSTLVEPGMMDLEKPWQSIGPYERTVCCEAVPRCELNIVDGAWEMQSTRGSGKM